MRHVKIVLMGSGGVGKTSLTTQFMREVFESRYEPTVEEFHRKTIELDGELCSLELLDTAGLDQFAQMRDVQIGEGQGFILVYAVTDKTTLVDAQMIREEIIKIKTNSVPVILVGNKCDLQNLREVTTKEGEDLASKWPHCAFLETSAKSKEHTDEIFTTAANNIILFQRNERNRNDLSKKKSSQNFTATSCNQCLVM